MANKAKIVIEVDAETGARQIEKITKAQDKVSKSVRDTGKAAKETAKATDTAGASLLKMAGSAISVGAVTRAVQQLADNIMKVSRATNQANDGLMKMVAIGASPSEARDTSRFMAARGISDMDAVTTAHRTATAISGGDAGLQRRLLQEQSDLINLGVDAEGAAGVIAMGAGRGLTPEEASALLVQSQARSRLTPAELARVISESQGDPRQAAAVGAALSQSIAGRKTIPAAGSVLDVLEGRTKPQRLTGSGANAWAAFEAHRGVYDELMAQELDPDATDKRLREIMADPSMAATKHIQAQSALNLDARRTGLSAEYSQGLERRALRRGGAAAGAGLGFLVGEDGMLPQGAALEVAGDMTRSGDILHINKYMFLLEGILNAVGRVADNTADNKGSGSMLTLGGGHGGTD